MRTACLIYFLLFFISFATAQIQPIQGAELNYNQVMLDHPSIHGVTGYITQVIEDSSAMSFEHPMMEIRDSFPASMVSQLKFGKSYLWRYAGVQKGKTLAWHGPYSFSIQPDPFMMNEDLRLRVTENHFPQNTGGLIVADGLHCIFDRSGALVWFFPNFNVSYRRKAGTSDLCLNKAGTITTLGGPSAMEYDLDGRMLWSSPGRVKSKILSMVGDFYNHDFKRLSNGNYMIIGQDVQWKKLPSSYDINKIINKADTALRKPVSLGDGVTGLWLPGGYIFKMEGKTNYVLMNMAQLMEFNKKDSLVWSWMPDTYVKEGDIFPEGGQLDSESTRMEPHLNGFSVDAKNEFVYASFRNLDRIAKVEKKTGKVVYSWGSKLASGEANEGEGFFHKQHSPVILDDGNIAVFNNTDTSARTEPSSAVIFSQPGAGKPSKLIWKFNCTFDSVMAKNKSYRAGNVELVPNNHLLVCMGAINRIFEVDHNKKMIWNAVTEKNSHSAAGWVPVDNYRAHYSSSLYPCYFTIETDKDTLEGNNTSFTLKISNEGTDSNSYTIAISSASNSYHTEKSVGTVPPRHSARLSFSPVAPPVHGEKIIISVKANINMDKERKATLVYK